MEMHSSLNWFYIILKKIWYCPIRGYAVELVHVDINEAYVDEFLVK